MLLIPGPYFNVLIWNVSIEKDYCSKICRPTSQLCQKLDYCEWKTSTRGGWGAPLSFLVPLIVSIFILPQGHSICQHTLLVLCRDLKLVCSGPFLSGTLAAIRLLVLHILLVFQHRWGRREYCVSLLSSPGDFTAQLWASNRSHMMWHVSFMDKADECLLLDSLYRIYLTQKPATDDWKVSS